MTETTYTNLRQMLASVLDRVANDHEVVIVSRKAHKRVAGRDDSGRRVGRIKGDSAPIAVTQERSAAAHSIAAGNRSQKGRPEPLEKLRRDMALAPQR
ncbi:MAG TPA: hypothetical protein VN901_30125 [Candidatus Acidoferrales bacterium]|nr:hypothetical protein [Candidatus Acidoferrales bacterium]